MKIWYFFENAVILFCNGTWMFSIQCGLYCCFHGIKCKTAHQDIDTSTAQLLFIPSFCYSHFPREVVQWRRLNLGSIAFLMHAIKTQKADVCRSQSGMRETLKRLHACRSKSFLQTKYTRFFFHSSPSPWMSKISKYSSRKPCTYTPLKTVVRSRWQT